MSMWCFKYALRQTMCKIMRHSIAEYFLLKTAVNQRIRCQKHSLKSLVFLTSQTTL